MIFLALTVSMLVCSIPSGVIFALYLSNKDPRKFGSLNIGMTNAWRVCGWKVGLLTLAGDLGKSALVLGVFQVHLTVDEISLLAFSTVFFHCYSVYLNFKGGKGLASASGALLIISPFWSLVLFLIWLSLKTTTKSSSTAAFVTIAGMLVICFTALYEHQMGFIAICTLVAWRHHENAVRLINGTELS